MYTYYAPMNINNFIGWAQLYARRHFLFPPLNIEECNDRVMAVVRCEAQVLLFIAILGVYKLATLVGNKVSILKASIEVESLVLN